MVWGGQGVAQIRKTRPTLSLAVLSLGRKWGTMGVRRQDSTSCRTPFLEGEGRPHDGDGLARTGDGSARPGERARGDQPGRGRALLQAERSERSWT